MGSQKGKRLTIDEVTAHEELTSIFRRFCKERDLDFEPYYHDEPLWLLSEPPNRPVMGHLQAGVYLEDKAEILSLIASVIVVDQESGGWRIPRRGRGVHIPLSKLLEDGKLQKKLLRKKLEKRWQVVDDWKREIDSQGGAEELVDVPLAGAPSSISA